MAYLFYILSMIQSTCLPLQGVLTAPSRQSGLCVLVPGSAECFTLLSDQWTSSQVLVRWRRPRGCHGDAPQATPQDYSHDEQWREPSQPTQGRVTGVQCILTFLYI